MIQWKIWIRKFEGKIVSKSHQEKRKIFKNHTQGPELHFKEAVLTFYTFGNMSHPKL